MALYFSRRRLVDRGRAGPSRRIGRLVGMTDDLEPVDLVELRLLRLGGAGHAGELLVHAEVVLDGDGGEGLRLALDLHPFLGLDRLVQPVRPAAARHDAAGELVDDQDLAVLHHVVDVLLVQGVRLQQLVDDVELLALAWRTPPRSARRASSLARRRAARVLLDAAWIASEMSGTHEERRVVRATACRRPGR